MVRKSTISTLISGTMTPTTGALEVNGDVSIIALGTGLIPNLTGRENILFWSHDGIPIKK
ncbi:hypothetical protein QK908_02275 [Lactococcus cremoris]